MSGSMGSLAACYGIPDDLPPALAAEVAGLPEVRVAAGTLLFSEGSACHGFPMLIEGRIRVCKTGGNGREIMLYRVLPGESCVITSSCLLGGIAYNAIGIAEQPLRMRVLPRELFDRLIVQVPLFRRFVFQFYGERLAELMRLVEVVAFQRLDARLAGLLLARSAHGTLPVRITHQQLADELGSVREIVTRTLSQFVDDGLVRLSRGRIDVLDPAHLLQRRAD